MDAHDAMQRMKQSLGDVWAATFLGKITPAKQAEAEKYEFAMNVIETIEDMIDD
jgi:hypothetical protein